MGISHGKTKKGWLVFVESNTSGTGRLFANRASAHGYWPVMLAEKPERYPYLELDGIHCLRCNTSSMEALRQSVEELSREAPISGIFSSSDYFIETAAALAQTYGLPGPNPQSTRACRNKSLQRAILKDAGLVAPEFRVPGSADAAIAALDEISLPVIIKPIMGSGSVGVRLCCTPAEVREHSTRLLQRTVNERGLPTPSELLIEQYLAGDEFSVEALNGEIVGVTRKHVSPEPFFVETGHDFPAGLSSEVQNKIAVAVKTALQSLGLTWGPAHIELRLTAAGPAIIEVNPRLAGGYIPEIVRLASGVDMIGETLKLVVGTVPDLRPVKRGHTSIRFIIPGNEGTIKGFTGFEQAWQIEGVMDIQSYRKIGESVRIEHDFRDRVGHVIASGPSEALAARAAETARAKISIEIDPQ